LTVAMAGLTRLPRGRPLSAGLYSIADDNGVTGRPPIRSARGGSSVTRLPRPVRHGRRGTSIPRSGAMSDPLGDPRVGSVFDGKYQIVERLGAGGMGTVYRALHLSLGAPRALKMMRPELAGDPGLAARFRAEARLAEGLRHPHLVALYDFGQLPDG